MNTTRVMENNETIPKATKGKTAIIIGAGPAGLTAAFELLSRTDIHPIIIEKCTQIGGISKTINYKGNKLDFGPHRFFSKSDRVMNWWTSHMPIYMDGSQNTSIHYQNKSRSLDPRSIETSKPGNEIKEKSMLLIKRLTRIYFLNKFFNYPIELSLVTLKQLGLTTTIKIIASYLLTRLLPRNPENNLEDFMINKFGKVLYSIFFKDYTEKVWGVNCKNISAEWGAQRIKGVSLSKAIIHAAKSISNKTKGNPNQKESETSLIEQFLYPAGGAGSMWEEVARKVTISGGTIITNQEVVHIYIEGNIVYAVDIIDNTSGVKKTLTADYFISTMPIQELISNIDDNVPHDVKNVAAGLMYRDFIIVGVLLNKMRLDTPKDNWIYIQEKNVKLARLQIYNNWGPDMVKDANTVWLGLEYFCNKGDEIWGLDDDSIKKLAITELERISLIYSKDVLDVTVQRMEKTYPAYFGTYNKFHIIRNYIDKFENLFLVGRNGMHKYNNADHSMLTAMVAVDNICAGSIDKSNIWAINTEQEYHEAKSESPEQNIDNKQNQLRQPIHSNQDTSFYQYLLHNNQILWLSRITLFSVLLQFTLFKMLYPFANYMPDSYIYLEAAARNVDVSMWPVGYSKFLRIFSSLAHSDTVLVGFQYLLIIASGLYFLFSLFYLLRPSNTVKFTIWLLFIFNPILLYVSNYISADSIFIGLSLLWITELLWIVFRPQPLNIAVHTILLLMLFTIRNNAIYYPLLTVIAFIISKQNIRVKITGILLATAVVYASASYTIKSMKDITGYQQYSAFSGWQLANNALYMYSNVPKINENLIPSRFAKLERTVREHFDTLDRVKFTKEDSIRNYFYLWSDKGPLIQFMIRESSKDTTETYFKKWASKGPLYSDYGWYLIKQHPIPFSKHFLLPNAIKYAVPPMEFLEVYNMGLDSVGQSVQEWFHYKSQKVKRDRNDNLINIVKWYPVFTALTNVLFIISFSGLLILSNFKYTEKKLIPALILVGSLWIINFAFSVTAAPIVMRYQIFPSIIFFSFSLITVEYIISKNK
jgi:protoporphyrinogen oxidase